MKNFYNITINENGGTIYRRKARKKFSFYFAFQKAAGAALIGVSFLPAMLTGEGGEAIIFCLPIGIYTILTKNKVI